MKYLLSIAILLVFSFSIYSQDYDIIVNKGSSVESISKAKVKRIYLGKIKNLSGTKVIPINLDMSSTTASAFLINLVGKDPESYKEFWVEQQVKGAGSAPMVQKTSAMVIAIVSQIPGAIGYIEKGSATDAVKVITLK